MIGIYKITNKINGKCYIGQSNDIERRWKEHKNSFSNPNVSDYESKKNRAFRKYGIENFDFQVLEETCLEILTGETYKHLPVYKKTLKKWIEACID